MLSRNYFMNFDTNSTTNYINSNEVEEENEEEKQRRINNFVTNSKRHPRKWHNYVYGCCDDCWENVPRIWNSSRTDCAGSLRGKFTTLFPIPLASIEINHVKINGQRHPFLCVCLAQYRQLDVPFGTKKAIIDFLFHRMEKACYDFVQRVFPRIHQLMFLEAHDDIDLEDWNRLLQSKSYEMPDDTVAGERGRHFTELANTLRNTAMHCKDIDFGLIYDTVGWAVHLKDDLCLGDIQGVLKGLYCHQCKAEGIREPGWETSEQEQTAFERVMMITWPPCLTAHHLLNTTVRTLERACFNVWQTRKSPEDTMPWRTAADIELQEWFYHHKALLTSLVPEPEQESMSILLGNATHIRNANAHRSCLSTEVVRSYMFDAMCLLKGLGDTKSVLDIELAEFFLSSSRKSLSDRLLDSFGNEVDWDANVEAVRGLGRQHRGGYFQLSNDKNLQRMFLRAEQEYSRQSSLRYGRTKEAIVEPLEDEFGDGPLKQIEKWDRSWHHKLEETRFIDQSSEGNLETSDSGSGKKEPQTGYCLSGYLKRIKQAFAWEQISPPEGSKCDESDADSSSQQGDELYSGIDDLDYGPVIDLQAWIQSDAWLRPFVSESIEPLTPSEESDYGESESDDSDTLRNSDFDQDEFDYGSIDARPFPTYESRFRGGYRPRPGVDPALSINKATVEQLLAKDAVPYAWRRALLEEAEDMGIQSKEDRQKIATIGRTEREESPAIAPVRNMTWSLRLPFSLGVLSYNGVPRIK